MDSKTPQFDTKLDAILKDLQPHKRNCKQCGGEFEIFKEDIEFYHMLRVPPPTFCPTCRKQRRMVFSNNTMFYKRPCDVPGHTEHIISLFPELIPWKVYDHDYWWSDAWDSMSYGVEYDLSKPFFQQFKHIFQDVPLIQSSRDPKSVASEYTAYGLELKNCYYLFGGIHSENIFYGNWPIGSRDCIDILVAWNSESCYEIVVSKNNHNCSYIYFSDECMDSQFLYDCKNCFMCFWVEHGENLRYIDYSLPIKDSMDNTIAGAVTGIERLYETVNAASYDIKFSHYVRQSSHSVEYSINCLNCEYCFGCVGLRNKKYCVLNTQYSEEEYWKTVDEIKTNMLERGEYGEFFPISMSPYPCNASLAGLEFPRTKTEVEALGGPSPAGTASAREGGYWAESPISLEGIEPQKILRAPEGVPDDIKDVSDEILDKVIVCETTGKPFRIIRQELEFYRKHDLPLPTKHPYQRLMERFALKTPFRLWKYPCAKCGNETYTSYDPALKLTIYCEECYKRKVI